MSFETVENVLHIKADSVMTLAMAAVLLLLGYFVRNKVSFLGKYCIPAPVVGGFLFMFVTFAGHQSGSFTFDFTNTFQSPFMLAFFTTVGLGASVKLLKKGGVMLVADVLYHLRYPERSGHRRGLRCERTRSLRPAVRRHLHDRRPRRCRRLRRHL